MGNLREMHGLINGAIEGYLRDTFGVRVWVAIARRARLGFDRFEPLLDYDPALTDQLLLAAEYTLQRPRDALLEDLGTWLVAPPSGGRLRRLLRFGGVDFGDFLQSLEDLPSRARLALPDLHLPDLRVEDAGDGGFVVIWDEVFDGAAQVLTGLLRAMADDYGALVVIDADGSAAPRAVLRVDLLDISHTEGNRFHLGGAA